MTGEYDVAAAIAIGAMFIVGAGAFLYIWREAHNDTRDTLADAERKQWRGKIRIGKRTNARGDVQYCADYKLNWLADWATVHAGPPIKKDGWTIVQDAFDNFEDAKIAAQLKWNEATAKRAREDQTRFGPWRKIWP